MAETEVRFPMDEDAARKWRFVGDGWNVFSQPIELRKMFMDWLSVRVFGDRSHTDAAAEKIDRYLAKGEVEAFMSGAFAVLESMDVFVTSDGSERRAFLRFLLSDSPMTDGRVETLRFTLLLKCKVSEEGGETVYDGRNHVDILSPDEFRALAGEWLKED